MLELHKLIDSRCIKLSMEARKKEEAIEELVRLLYDADKVSEMKPIVDSLLDREKDCSSGIGQGIAIPHDLSIKGMESTCIAFGRKPGGIKFNSIDNKPVTLFFLILGPESHRINHLQLLSKLARILRNPLFRKTLMEAVEPEDIISAIKRQEEE